MLLDADRQADFEALAQYEHNPLAFAQDIYPWGEPGELEGEDGPRDWQAEVLAEIGEKLAAGVDITEALMPVLIARASGHGIGKSALVAWVIHWALATCVDCKVVLTANTEPQLRTKTWPEVAKWFRLAKPLQDMFSVQGLSIVSKIQEHAREWRADAVTWSESNLEAFAGLHNKGKRIVLIFDEASGITDRVWEVAEGALTDEDTEIVWLAFGNPTQPVGRFFEAVAGRQRHRWSAKQIDSRTVPGTNKKLFEEWKEAYGEDSDFFRVRVRGQFPRAGSMQFIGTDIVESATDRDVVCDLSDALVIGVDVARFGDDQSVILFRKGRDMRVIAPIKLRGVDTMELAARVMDEALRYRADAVHVDGGGVGGGVVDRLRAMRCQGVVDVQFGAKSDRASGPEGVKFGNKRAEMWGAMREWLKTASIPPDIELAADLAGPWYGFNANNEIMLERKEDMKRRGLASPDVADALALTFAYPVNPAAYSGGPFAGQQRDRPYNPHGDW